MKLIVADDEEYTREGLIEAISWEQYGIDEIMQAVNGAEAVKIAKWFRPDIVLTDVKMPKMNGIEFVTQLLQENPDCKVIFISGYMEIEYLKSALRLGAIDYIEKPIDRRLLEEVVKKTVEEIRQLKQGKVAKEDQKELQHKKLFSLLIQKEADEKTILKIANAMNFPISQYCQSIIGVCFDGQTVKTEDIPARLDKMSSVLRESFSSVLGNYNQEKRQYEFIISYAARDQYRLMPAYQRLLEDMPELRLGIGMEASGYKNVYNAYRTADAAANCAFYQEKQRLFRIDDEIMQRQFITPSIYSEFLKMLNSKPSQLSHWFDELFRTFEEQKYYHREQVYTLMISLLTTIYKQYPSLYGVHPQIMTEEEIPGYVTGRDCLRQIRELIGLLLDKIQTREEELSQFSRIVRGVQEYIEQHYAEEGLSVQEVAEAFHLSPAYLNVLFKNETKTTLKQYLSNYRLEQAKMMLEQGFDKITEIAVKCGYANANYFAKVFKEATGQTPAEYRREKSGYEE